MLRGIGIFLMILVAGFLLYLVYYGLLPMLHLLIHSRLHAFSAGILSNRLRVEDSKTHRVFEAEFDKNKTTLWDIWDMYKFGSKKLLELRKNAPSDNGGDAPADDKTDSVSDRGDEERPEEPADAVKPEESAASKEQKEENNE